MPNPLVRPGYKTAVQPDYPGNAPVARTPEQEEVWEEAHNIPYRGAVDHGLTHGSSVPSDLRKTVLNETINQSDDSDYLEEMPAPITPVPVVIYREDEPGAELKMFRVSRAYAGSPGNPARIVSRSDGRSKVSIQNVDVIGAWIGHDAASASPWNGFPLPSGAKQDLNTDQEIWAVADSGGNPLAIAVYVEYSAVNPA